MGVGFYAFNEVGQARSKWRDVLVVYLSEIPKHHNLGIRADATDDRFQLKLRQALRLINNDVRVIEGFYRA